VALSPEASLIAGIVPFQDDEGTGSKRTQLVLSLGYSARFWGDTDKIGSRFFAFRGHEPAKETPIIESASSSSCYPALA
jgi:hypothetical protein